MFRRLTSIARAHFGCRRHRLWPNWSKCADGGVFALFTSHRDVRHGGRGAASARDRPALAAAGARRRRARRRCCAAFGIPGAACCSARRASGRAWTCPGMPLRVLVLAKLPVSRSHRAAHRRALRGGRGARGRCVPRLHASRRGAAAQAGLWAPDPYHRGLGAVVLMDPRVLTRSYGALAARGLPPARRVVGPWDEVRPEIASCSPTRRPPRALVARFACGRKLLAERCLLDADR